MLGRVNFPRDSEQFRFQSETNALRWMTQEQTRSSVLMPELRYAALPRLDYSGIN